jgi:hypothetical protein
MMQYMQVSCTFGCSADTGVMMMIRPPKQGGTYARKEGSKGMEKE